MAMPAALWAMAVLCVLATLPLVRVLRRPAAGPGLPRAEVIELARAQGRMIVELQEALERYAGDAAAVGDGPPEGLAAAPAAAAPRHAAVVRPRKPGEAAAAPPRAPEPRKEEESVEGLTFAHVINPMPAGHGLHADVEVTFASLDRAPTGRR